MMHREDVVSGYQPEGVAQVENPRIASIQVGQPLGVEDDQGCWRSSIFKTPVEGRVWCGSLNIDGDAQANLMAHGGPDQAVLGYSADHYPKWREELNQPDFPHGAFGENLTVAGLDEWTACIGDSYAIGEAVIQVTSPRGPCWKIARRHQIPDLTARVLKAGRAGWYHRVLQEGWIEPGQEMALLERPHPGWTVARAMQVRYDRKRDRAALEELLQIPEIAPRFQDDVESRLARV